MNAFSTVPGRAPLGIAGALALVLAIEAIVGNQGDELSHLWAGDWKHGASAAVATAPGCRILCFGDSLMKYGLAPRILGERLGKPAYNLALGAAPPPVSYAMLEHALEAGAKPEAILVDFAPHFLAEGPGIASTLLPEVLDLRDAAELAWEERDPGRFASLALGRLFPTIKDRDEIRKAILDAFAAVDRTERRLAAATARRNWEVNRGGHMALRTPRLLGDDANWAGHLYPAKWSCTPLNRAYIRRFLRLAQARAIPVFWLIPPFSPEVHARRSLAGLDAGYERFVRGMAAKFPGITVVDGRKAGFSFQVHADPLHLDRRGAAIFTEEVAAVVAQSLGAGPGRPRWVDLPPFVDRPLDGPVEDILQSRLAVQADGAAARR